MVTSILIISAIILAVGLFLITYTTKLLNPFAFNRQANCHQLTIIGRWLVLIGLITLILTLYLNHQP